MPAHRPNLYALCAPTVNVYGVMRSADQEGGAMNFGRNKRALAGMVAAVAAVCGVVASASIGHAQPTETVGHVRVVHGLRGLVADVYLDGTLVLPTFRPERATNPLPIPAGDHLVEIRQAGAAATDEPLLTQNVTVPAGFTGSLVAHLDGDGNPKLTAYADDLSAVPAGQARVVVRHAAAAKPVNVLLNEQSTFTGLAPDAEANGTVAAGEYEVAVTPTRGGQPLASPERVEFADGTANFMYLIGSQSDGTLGWAAVQVKNLQTAPAGIQTGDGSTEADTGGSSSFPIGVLAVLVAAGGMVAISTRVRRHRPTP
jgi:hypothetical protein